MDGDPVPADPLRGRRRFLIGVVTGAVVMALAGLGASTLIKSPQQVAAEAAPPAPSLITATVERRVLQEAVVLRGTVEPDRALDVKPVLGGGRAVISRRTVKAGRPGVTWIDEQPAVFIGGTPFAVIGIVDDVDREAGTLLSAVVPAGTAHAVWGTAPGARAIVDTRIGAAQQVGDEAPLALRPEDPDRLRSLTPPDPRQLREGVDTDLGTLFLALASVCLLIGAVGIANTTLVAVLERVGEIGLRRALGARRRHVAAHFLAESGTLGLIGGLIGTSVGVAAVVAVAVLRDWTPILQPATVLPAPLAGALTGLVAGLYPAWRATRIEPADALRR